MAEEKEHNGKIFNCNGWSCEGKTRRKQNKLIKMRWTEENLCKPLMEPRMRRPMKIGKKQRKFHKEAHNPFEVSILPLNSITKNLSQIYANVSLKKRKEIRNRKQ